MKKHIGIVIALAVGSLLATSTMAATTHSKHHMTKHGAIKCVGIKSVENKSLGANAQSYAGNNGVLMVKSKKNL